jgi:catechol 2,3-dioxygenase-like lactoylglutathione lyase family enzyme
MLLALRRAGKELTMISKMSHAAIFVLNQQAALEFYRDKLGFEVRTDATMDGGYRWLTVGPKDQPDFEIILMEPNPGYILDEAAANQVRDLVQRGKLGGGVFDTVDCKATYEELSAKGVEFLSPPAEQPWGIGAVFKDNSGNWFSLSQHPED